MAEQQKTNSNPRNAVGVGAAVGAVHINGAAISNTKVLVDGYSKKLNTDLQTISKYVGKIAEVWNSEVSRKFVTETEKQINLIRNENETIDKNITTFLEFALRLFEDTEKSINTNADLFR